MVLHNICERLTKEFITCISIWMITNDKQIRSFLDLDPKQFSDTVDTSKKMVDSILKYPGL
jgi:hypothetical protein